MDAGNHDKCTLSIDLGTGSCKVCLLGPRSGIIATASSRYVTHRPFQSWAEQDPTDWIEAAKRATRELLDLDSRRAASVECIVLTSAAHIGVLCDKSFRPVRRSMLWSDQRTIDVAERLKNEQGERIFSISANGVSPSWTLAHLVWVRENEPSTWARIRRVGSSKDYLLRWLSNQWVTDPATAVATMLCDAREGDWSTALCEIAGLDIEMLPTVKGSSEVVGQLSADAGRQLGLSPGIPIVNGSLDSATETYGAGLRSPGEYLVRIGTAGGIHFIRESGSADSRLLTYPYVADELWYSQAGTSSAGSAIAWAITAAKDAPTSNDYAEFSQLAATAPAGSDGVMFHPYLAGERTPYWDSSLRGVFSGISFGHDKRHFARAVVEGVAFSLMDAFESLCPREAIPANVPIVGGGTLDPVLMQIVSSVFGKPVKPLRYRDSAFGAALLGSRAINRLEDWGTIHNGDDKSIEPDCSDAALYEELFRRYKKRAGCLTKLYRES